MILRSLIDYLQFDETGTRHTVQMDQLLPVIICKLH